MTFLQKDHKIFVAGHNGLVGSALVSKLQEKGYRNLLKKTRTELNLLRQSDVEAFFLHEKPDVVFLAAAKVGGIHANNTLRADFIFENLAIQSNIIWSAFTSGVKRLVFLGSSCIYPKYTPQPMQEASILTGELEYTNRPYAIAKIAGIELVNSLSEQHGCEYFSVMPTNLYGPNDNFDLQSSHVLPALLSKFLSAKETGAETVTIWGSGTPLREFMYSLDCADAIVYLAETLSHKKVTEIKNKNNGWSHINIGSGEEISIRDLATLIATATKFQGQLIFDAFQPDGTPRKLLDCRLLHELGWKKSTSLHEGIEKTLAWIKEQKK